VITTAGDSVGRPFRKSGEPRVGVETISKIMSAFICQSAVTFQKLLRHVLTGKRVGRTRYLLSHVSRPESVTTGLTGLSNFVMLMNMWRSSLSAHVLEAVKWISLHSSED